ncbi:hypothetical protein F66182_8473 [Fusarium sp. NRRL 66182]|nr:hypothetical protein F66182_8473 [Fusarium sp. NRRL 66182]
MASVASISHLFSLPPVWLMAAGLFLAYRVGLMVWRVFFHPLARFPGPKLWASSYLPYYYYTTYTGTLGKDALKLHQKYGPIVRISPNRLAVDGSIGWSDIFAHRPGQPEFLKSADFYGTGRVGLLPSLRDDHRRQRRLVSHAFSSASMADQEDYIKHYMDIFITRLREQMHTGKAVDMTRWYNFLTFDIIGELAFGDSFQCLESSDYHPWVSLIFNSVKSTVIYSFLNHYPLLRPLLYLVIGTKEIKDKEESDELARVKTEKRLALGTDTRKDFMTSILKHNKDGAGMSHQEMLINARAFIVAGSETTATTLSGLTYFLTHNRDIYDLLVKEIRESFTSDGEISLKTTASLEYLKACVEETLRAYPAAADTPPRISPGAMVGGQYVPEGVYLNIYQWATHRSPRNFTDPDSFKPQRFLPATHPLYDARYAGDNKAAFKPFSAGPRDCVGKNLAYAEIRLAITRLLWNFDIEAAPGQDDWASSQLTFIVYEKGPLMIKIKPRVMT